MHNDWVVVYVGEFTIAAHVKNLLDAADIQAISEDEMATLYPPYGGRNTKILVHKSDEEKAKSVLRDFQETVSAVGKSSQKRPRTTGIDKVGAWLLLGLSFLVIGGIAVSINSQMKRAKDIWTPLMRRADQLSSEGKEVEAREVLQEALKEAQTTYGFDSHTVDMTLSSLIMLYDEDTQQTKYQELEGLLKQLLSNREARLGLEHVKLVDPLFGLAHNYIDQGKYQEAEPVYHRIIAIKDRTFGPEDPDIIAAHKGLSYLYRLLGRYAEARSEAQEALIGLEKSFGPDNLEIADVIENAAHLAVLSGVYQTAESFYERLLKIREKDFGLDHPAVAATLVSYANLLRKMGDAEKAETFEQRAKAIYAKQQP